MLVIFNIHFICYSINKFKLIADLTKLLSYIFSYLVK